MKKLILSLVLFLAVATVRAQTTLPESGEHSEWLPSFTEIVADGSFDMTLEMIPDTEAPKVVYDTKGSYTTKFRAEVRDGVLYLRERADARRPERTTVRVCCNNLAMVTATDAAVSFADTLRLRMLDVSLAGAASLRGAVDMADLDVNLTGRSKAVLSGSVRYLTLFASTGSIDAGDLSAMSARVTAQSNATVLVRVTDRLEGKTSTGGAIRYKGRPELLRVARKFMAGDVKSAE